MHSDDDDRIGRNYKHPYTSTSNTILAETHRYR